MTLQGIIGVGAVKFPPLTDVGKERSVGSLPPVPHGSMRFITCTSEGVVYLIQCPCGLQYVGRTKRAPKVRLTEHINNIRRGFDKHPVSRHFDEVHSRDPSNTLYVGIDKYRPHWRGSSLVREIYKCEMSWIYRLRTYAPFGLNVDTDVNAFINKSECNTLSVHSVSTYLHINCKTIC